MIHIFEGNTLNIAGSALFSAMAPVSSYGTDFSSPSEDSFIRYTVPVDYSEFKDRLNNIIFLSDNWDGYGAEVPGLGVYNNVVSFLGKLDGCVLSCLDVDDIEPTPYGTITLDFVYGDKLVSVEIGNSKIGFFSELPGVEKLRLKEENFDSEHLPEVLIRAFKILVG